MHNNYFFLRQLAAALNERLCDFQIVELFSQNKDELIIAAYRGEKEFFIRATLSPEFSCLSFPENFNRAKRNSADIFPELNGSRIIGVRPIAYDRSLIVELDSEYQLLFKMHGNRSNALLMENGRCIKLFKTNLKNDQAITSSSLRRDLNLTEERFKAVDGNIRAFLPVLGKAFDAYFKQQDYEKKSLEVQWKIIRDLLPVLQNPTFYICQDNGLPIFSLLDCQRDIVYKGSDPIRAVNQFFDLFIKNYQLNKERKEFLQPLEHRQKKIAGYVRKAENKLDQLRHATRYDQLADIIMANLFRFTPGVEKVTLDDFYTGGTIEVTLKPQQTPQKLAENYYKKAKNQKIEIETLSSNIQRKKEESASISQLICDVEKTEHLKDLRALRQKYSGTAAEDDSRSLPYHQVDFLGYTIYIGKNAAKNDLLTFKIASKNDLWLHVKDATGSHVIVKQHPGQNFPEVVIEKAAELAACYSKRKQETVCPVSYTLKKYVRKPKGAKPGAVVIEREKVILVNPQV